MTIGADAIDPSILIARPQQGVSDNPHGPASGHHPLKLVFSNMERPDVATRWQSVSKSSSGMLGNSCDHNAGTVYERIKLRLLQKSWIPGELLQIGMLARELGTSTTPVREALVRLAAERLIAYTPKKGFLVKAITEEELRGLYLVNQMYLQAAIRYSCDQTGNMPMRPSSDSKRRFAERDGADQGINTANLFLNIAALAEIDELTAMVCNINNRLHRSRIAECTVIDGIPQEMSVISDLSAAGDCNKLNEAIQQYHGVRLRMLPSICKEMLSMSFAKR